MENDIREKLKDLAIWLRKNAGDDADDLIDTVWEAQDKINTLHLSEDIPKEENDTLVGRFVATVGHDFYDHWKDTDDNGRWPAWSDTTKVLWKEIEDRLTVPKCLDFDREGCIEEIRQEIKEQKEMASRGDYVSSYHCGIAAGLSSSWRKIEEHTHGHNG